MSLPLALRYQTDAAIKHIQTKGTKTSDKFNSPPDRVDKTIRMLPSGAKVLHNRARPMSARRSLAERKHYPVFNPIFFGEQAF